MTLSTTSAVADPFGDLLTDEIGQPKERADDNGGAD